MSVIDRIRARYEAIASEPVCEVSEWGEDGEALVVYAKPWTQRDHDHFAKRYPDRDWSPYVVVEKALAENGDRLFEKADIVDLGRLGERFVVTRVAHAIQFSMTLEDAKKNSETTPESE